VRPAVVDQPVFVRAPGFDVVTKAQVRDFLKLFESVLASVSASQMASNSAPKESNHSPRLARSAAR